MAGALIGNPAGTIDWERLGAGLDRPGALDAGLLDQYEAVNSTLWRSFAAAEIKSTVTPLVRGHLRVVIDALRMSHPSHIHGRVCRIAADLLQLSGELAFDANRYAAAADAYSLAATASREAEAFDLWACALTRYAYINIYEGSFGHAQEMLEVAANLAVHGDPALSTRHWVQSVRAQASAGLGSLNECQRALDAAESVCDLGGMIHNGGWLRFDGSRTAEERGTCYVTLHRPDLAEPLLERVLRQRLSIRRRGAALTDLALVGAQLGDPQRIVFYGAAALDAEQQSGSGALKQRLHGLHAQLGPFRGDPHVYHLSRQLDAVLASGL
jgi:hypothetical protein